MSRMFVNCKALTALDLSSFNTAKVTNMSYMFHYCEALTALDLSSFNTAAVTDMSFMFTYCRALTALNVSSFNTAAVTNMSYMFHYCDVLTRLDLSSFNTAKVTNMKYMFTGCEKMTTIYVGNGWTTDAVTQSTEMFLCCDKLVGGSGTAFDKEHVDAAYAHIDGGTVNPGYFSEKPAFLLGDVNGDGLVTIADVTALVNIILGKSTDYNTAVVDVNNDNVITIADVTALVNIILGK